jgi:MFS family permease
MDGLIASQVATGLAGVALLAAFAFWERRARNPIVPLEILRTPQLVRTYALEIVIGILEGSLFFIPAVLVAAEGLSSAAAGFAAALGALAFVLVIPASGRALDRIGSRDVLLAGTIVSEIGLALFALGFSSLPVALLAIVIAGAGFGALLGAPTRYIVTNETPARARATAVGLLSQALIVGQILGSSLAGGLMSAGQTELAGYRHAYLAFCAVAFVALLLATTLKPRDEERRRPIEEAA